MREPDDLDRRTEEMIRRLDRRLPSTIPAVVVALVVGVGLFLAPGSPVPMLLGVIFGILLSALDRATR